MYIDDIDIRSSVCHLRGSTIEIYSSPEPLSMEAIIKFYTLDVYYKL